MRPQLRNFPTRLRGGGLGAEGGWGVAKERDGAGVGGGRVDGMIARAKQRCDRQMQRRHSPRGADRADPALERGQALLEHGGRRI